MLTLFFVENLPTTVGEQYLFDNEDALHAIRVLRTNIGEIFNLSDGKGAWSRVQVEAVNKKSLQVKVLATGVEDPLTQSLTVIQAIPKGDRAKEAVELCTVGGADRIVMWAASRSIGKSDEKLDKLQITAREASKQSRRLRIPSVVGVATTENIIDEIAKSDLAIVLHEGASAKISELISTDPKKILIIVGPEGGLTEAEVDTFAAAGAKVALLGRPILRSAHAGLAALSAVNTALSVW